MTIDTMMSQSYMAMSDDPELKAEMSFVLEVVAELSERYGFDKNEALLVVQHVAERRLQKLLALQEALEGDEPAQAPT